MLLSIIVPVYNMAADDKLKHCMDSLINQNLSDYEIIAVNDASTDESLSILEEYKANYPDKVKVITYPDNKKQGGAKNAGLDAANGKWVGFIDSDDWISPDMYKKLIDKADATGADLVGCDYTIVDKYTFEHGQDVVNNTPDQTGVLDDEKHAKHILRSGSMVVKIYLRSVIEDHHLRFPEHILYEDNCAGPLWSMYFKRFERVDEALYYYLTLPDSTTHHVTWERCLDRVKAGHELLKECKDRRTNVYIFKDMHDDISFYDKYRNEIEYRYAELCYSGTLFSYMYSGKNRKLKNTDYLKKDIIEHFPEFRKNPYYESMMKEEDKKFIDIQMKSNFRFFLHYILLFAYRNLRKRK